MNSIATAVIILGMVFLLGCINPQGGTGDSAVGDSAPDEGAVTQPSVEQLQQSENEIAALDSDLQDLETLLEDSDFEDVEFLALDESTFR